MTTLAFYTEKARIFAEPGTITKTARAWYEKAKARREAYLESRDPLPRGFGTFARRAEQKMLERYMAEISARGFDIYIEERYRTTSVKMLDRQDDLWLVGCDGWRHYSNRFGQRYASLRYLCGTDDNGDYAVRCPGSVETVEDALDYTIPAEVQKAREAGKRVIRQGDVFVIELKRDGKQELPEGHTFDPETRMLVHEGGHETVHIPFPCKFLTAYGLPPRSAYRGRRTGWWD